VQTLEQMKDEKLASDMSEKEEEEEEVVEKEEEC
jgi:hypothetical protein